MRRFVLLILVLCWFELPFVRAEGRPPTAPDLSKIDRQIKKEPVYIAEQVLYGLYVFGPQAKTHVWAVLDKSHPDARNYDVLYFDRNADGDLTAADERIVGKTKDDETLFDLGALTDRHAEQTHTDVSIRHTDGKDSMTMFRMKWNDKVQIRGGYASEPGPYAQFARSPAEAPVMWPGADGTFSFQFWMIDILHIGDAEDVRVFLGHQGHGKNTFCAVPDTFLPKEVPVIATLIYHDKDGKEQCARSDLKQRC